MERHGNKFDYSKVNYVGTHSSIIMVCKKHGEFIQTPRQHLRGKTGGCLKCARLSKDTHDFVNDAVKIHGERYSYDLTIYKNAKTKLTIGCSLHGDFLQLPRIHLSGSGCPKCSLYQHSKKSIRWLNYRAGVDDVLIDHFENVGEYKIPGTRYKADSYCRDTNTIYEFQGDAFHGNPKKFKSGDKCHPFDKNITAGALLKRTQRKIDTLKKLGYIIIIAWESEWDKFENEQND